MQFTRAERISLKQHPELNEKWVQNLIADAPSIIGLGELELRDKERSQPRAGRLDLLLQDPDTKRRYEVEIQLGQTDEAHIIRTIEYWDIERKRYPQYDHCAVLIAEDITSRFLNVISLFNGTIPIIALQMHALTVGSHTTLVFTKVIDELVRGLVDEDEEAEAALADRSYWEKIAPKTMKIVDELIGIAKTIDPELDLNYNKPYIGIKKNGHAFNFAIFRPKKNWVNAELKLEKTTEIDELLNSAEIDTLSYTAWGAYRLQITDKDMKNSKELIRHIMEKAYQARLA